MLIDSHCHIDGEQFDGDRDEVVQRAKDAGVAAMLNVGTGDPNTDDFRRGVAVAERYENVFASVGVHPHDAKLYDDKAENHLVELAKSSAKVIAWGEIGLDFHYDHSPRDVQRDVFRRQIRVARKLDLPIIVHSRKAEARMLEVLVEEEVGRVDWHCFGGKVKLGRLRNAVAKHYSFFDLTANRVDSSCPAARKIPGGNSFIFAHQAKQYMLGCNYGRTVLERFVTCEKNDTARPFGVAFEHNISASPSLR